MSAPTGPSSSPPDPTTDPAVVELERELAAPEPGPLVRLACGASRGVRLLALAAGLTGLVALVLGVAAWHDPWYEAVVVALVCLPAVAGAAYVARRARQLAAAATHPQEVAAQARDLLGRVRTSPELSRLATRVRERRLAASGAGRVRGMWQLARLATTVVGQAQPDPDRHRYLVPFAPERIRNTWLGVVVTLWGWAVAAVVAVVAALTLLVRQV